MTNLNYQHLYYFWEVAKHGGITKACEKLLLAQPTVSAQLKQFSKSIGLELFKRNGRNLVLSEDGKMVFEYASKIFSLGNNLRQKIQLGEKASNTTIRIGIADVLPRELVFSLINPLMADGLNIFLQCHDDETHALLGKLALGELDIVISDVPVNPFIKVKSYNHIIGESPVTFIGSYQLVARFKPGFPESLAKAPFLMPMKGTSLRQILDNWFDENNIIPNIVAELADIDLFEDFGKSGKGFFALPHVATTGILKNQNLKILGKALGAKESFFIISPEKILKNEIALLILKNAKASLFNQVA
ncbi:MAG: hypothetical protein RL595_2905 [Planctomycetota bacterium]|jgi:LysR family transcriptional activator of nhaA